jgi:hypothetical protein
MGNTYLEWAAKTAGAAGLTHSLPPQFISRSIVPAAIEAPSSINYLAVTLKAGEAWRYEPPTGHAVLWVGNGNGVVEAAPESLEHGEIVVFEAADDPVAFRARTDADFVIASAARHPHDLVLGYYSVHSSADALRIGEAQIDAIRDTLVAKGLLQPAPRTLHPARQERCP